MACKESMFNEDINKVVLTNALGNSKFTSPAIQKEILKILANKIKKKIQEEVGDAKYCILVDEALDESNTKQMAIILRFVDYNGFIREPFFGVVGVEDTTSLTLKTHITEVLTKYNLQIVDMRGQGYDGASNMRGAWNSLQSLFLND
ncbi:hypothetical protein Dsin_016665 [Dipteronia sinensis]|uniref:DUF4371 domain-containing protein n=1 Tax=Dipteronia sinensis TaxID=43782 RepID=A0AAE0ADM9_9ROSI|nr:hypothetical protein Dsin_016665 [Dipteronia sinensis]